MTTENATIIDPLAAEAAAARAEIADLDRQVTLFEKAESAVDRQIAAIMQADLSPIRVELAMLRLRRERAQARLDIADYLTVSPSEEGRQRHLREVEGAALRSYRHAQQLPGSPKERIEAAWSAVVGPYASSKHAIGLPRMDGTVLTQVEHEATFYKRFLAVTKQMNEFEGMPFDDRLKARLEDRAQSL